MWVVSLLLQKGSAWGQGPPLTPEQHHGIPGAVSLGIYGMDEGLDDFILLGTPLIKEVASGCHHSPYAFRRDLLLSYPDNLCPRGRHCTWGWGQHSFPLSVLQIVLCALYLLFSLSYFHSHVHFPPPHFISAGPLFKHWGCRGCGVDLWDLGGPPGPSGQESLENSCYSWGNWGLQWGKNVSRRAGGRSQVEIIRLGGLTLCAH